MDVPKEFQILIRFGNYIEESLDRMKESYTKNIILLTDIIEQKVRKEKELEYYQKQMEELQRKMFFVRKEIDVTSVIIDIIEQEKVVDLREYTYKRLEKNEVD